MTRLNISWTNIKDITSQLNLLWHLKLSFKELSWNLGICSVFSEEIRILAFLPTLSVKRLCQRRALSRSEEYGTKMGWQLARGPSQVCNYRVVFTLFSVIYTSLHNVSLEVQVVHSCRGVILRAQCILRTRRSFQIHELNDGEHEVYCRWSIIPSHR